LSGERRRCTKGVEWTVTVTPRRTSVRSRSQRPDGLLDEAFREIKRPVLVLSRTKDGSDAGDRYRTLLPDCHFTFVYDAGRAIGAERPEPFAYIADLRCGEHIVREMPKGPFRASPKRRHF
jgi:hypothetical protein